MATSYGYSDTRLLFGGSRWRTLQHATVTGAQIQFPKGAVITARVGSVVDGQIYRPGETHDIQPGFVWLVGGGRRLLGNEPKLPFLVIIGVLSGSHSSTRNRSTGDGRPLHALDAKADVALGWTLWDVWSPYLGVRAFGGPVFWGRGDDLSLGTDLYHVSVAAGFDLTFANRVSVYFDGAFLGARSLGGGISFRI